MPLFDRTLKPIPIQSKKQLTFGYFGTYDNLNDIDLHHLCQKHDVLFIKSDNPSDWTTLCYQCDAIIAIRKNITSPYNDKPASKLINAIKLGIPIICGKESAYVYEWKNYLQKTPSVRFVSSNVELEKEIIFVKNNITQLKQYIQTIQHVYSNKSFAERFYNNIIH